MNDSSMEATAPARVMGALALELSPMHAGGRDALAQDVAGALAAHMANDLAAFAPEAATLDICTVAAHYDPVELLRPSWPLHDELWQLAARAPRAPGGGARVIAFGSHDGRLPGTLAPDASHQGGMLRLVPFVMGGDAATVARVSRRCEADLMEEGMAGAATALAMQEAFGLRIEHARYLTIHDLCALIAVQYRHAGLEPLWPLLETALLAPGREAVLDAPPEPWLRYRDGEVQVALFGPRAWCLRHAPGDAACPPGDAEGEARLARLHRHFEARQRQFAGVLRAHGIPVAFVHADDPSTL
jgi:hypothetical protein